MVSKQRKLSTESILKHDSTSVSDLTDFERERLERIKQNQERMKILNLDSMVQSMQESRKRVAPAVSQKGLEAKRRSEPAPRRRSSRLLGEKADGGEIVRESKGNILISNVNNTSLRRELTGQLQEEVPLERHSKSDLEFNSENADAHTDQYFISMLRELDSATGKVKSSRNRRVSGGASLETLRHATLNSGDVAKITKSAVTHLTFMPTSNDLIIAATDKKGHVGLWRVNEGDNNQVAVQDGSMAFGEDSMHQIKEEQEDVSVFDGVLAFKPHNQYVSGLAWTAGFPGLVTSAYDGSARQLDLESSRFLLAWGDEEMEYSSLGVMNDGKRVLLGDNLGQLDMIDITTRKRVVSKPTFLHQRKINTVHTDPLDANAILTSSTDSTLALWDARKLGPKAVPLSTAKHRQTCQSAYFSPDGSQRILSTSFDNTIRIWDGKDSMRQVESIRHDNNTGRWVLPLRAVWNASGDAAIVGNMKRFVDIYDASSGSMVTQLSSEWMTAIGSRNCVHATLPILASATASGRVHIFRCLHG